jgi:imidazolonepropionase-like amidohydrolase
MAESRTTVRIAFTRSLTVWLVSLCSLTPAASAHAADLAIVGAKTYPSPEAAAIPDATVLLHDGRILAVGAKSRVRVPRGFKILRADGRVLLAGFWNCHVHLVNNGLLQPETLNDQALSDALTKMFTRWGFTTVFDLASTMNGANDIRIRIDAGRVVGPRILTVGEPFYPPHGTPVYAEPIYREFHLPSAEITTSAAAVRRVDRQVREGANGIKLFTGSVQGGSQGAVHMPAKDIRAITAEAHRLGRPVFAHPTDVEGLNVAVDNGVNILAHTDPLGGPWSRAFVSRLKVKHVALIPTLMLFDVEPDPRTPVDVGVQQLAAQAKAGGDILFGTDAGFIDTYDPTQEYRLMARAISWRAILASLTTTPARRFGRSASLGRVKAGFVADLTLLDGDPASDPANFAHVRAVLRDGRIAYSANGSQELARLNR